jgi:hypothetical protein
MGRWEVLVVVVRVVGIALRGVLVTGKAGVEGEVEVGVGVEGKEEEQGEGQLAAAIVRRLALRRRRRRVLAGARRAVVKGVKVVLMVKVEAALPAVVRAVVAGPVVAVQRPLRPRLAPATPVPVSTETVRLRQAHPLRLVLMQPTPLLAS